MKSQWFALYVADYLAKTCHLTQAQHGAYMLLMLHYYATEKPIPASAMQVHAICRCTTDAERGAANTVLQLFFTRDGDFYRHKRIDEELATRSKLRAKRQDAASKRWHANGMQLHTQSQSQSQLKERSKSLGTRIPEDFIPKQEHYEIASELQINCEMEFVKFRDYFLGISGTKGLKRDWDATLRNWLRNSVNYGSAKQVRQVSAVQERTKRNREALLHGFGVAPNARSSGADHEAGSSTRRGPLLEGHVPK